MPDFITLTCPSCGGKLKITNDLQRFACSYCGTEHIINRGEGVISLAPVVESWKKAQIGIERTASEMAITRLKEEIAELDKEIGRVRKKSVRNSKNFVYGGLSAAFGILLLLSALLTPSNSQNNNVSFGVILLLIGAVLILTTYQYVQPFNKLKTSELNHLLKLRTQKEKDLNYHENIVSQPEFSPHS
jgi:predicted Holliday junction resolvase-like endonuclease